MNCYFQQRSEYVDPALTNEIEILKATSHSHIVSFKNSFQGKFYVMKISTDDTFTLSVY